MSDKNKHLIKAVAAATAPVFFGYIFVGMAFGLLLQKAGYHFLWAAFCSIIVYAGSMQFILVSLLSGWIGLLQVAVVTFAVQIRHAFYGLSLIEKFKEMGKLRPYMIFSLTDETYTLLCSAKAPEGISPKRFYFLIALFNQCYWVVGGVLGATIGELVPFNSTGIDFAMSALFVVIFVEQWLTSKNHIPALVGLGCALITLLLFGTEGFLPPALLLTVVVLMLARKPMEAALDAESASDGEVAQ